MPQLDWRGREQSPSAILAGNRRQGDEDVEGGVPGRIVAEGMGADTPLDMLVAATMRAVPTRPVSTLRPAIVDPSPRTSRALLTTGGCVPFSGWFPQFLHPIALILQSCRPLICFPRTTTRHTGARIELPDACFLRAKLSNTQARSSSTRQIAASHPL